MRHDGGVGDESAEAEPVAAVRHLVQLVDAVDSHQGLGQRLLALP